MLRKRLLTLIIIILLGPAGVLIADPSLEVSWSEEIGFPEFIDWNRAFMDVFNGGPYSITVTIQNAGDTDLIIEDITCEEQEFYADPTNLILEPDQSSDVRFIFNAREPGEYESVMQIIWNSPDGEVFGIPVIGEADGPPDMEWDVGPIEEDMLTGEIVQRVCTIDNDGGTPLRFQIYHEIIGEPDRDNAVRSIRRSVGNQNGPRRDDPGDLIDQFEIPNGGRRLYNSGLAWDSENNWMWITQWEVPFRAIAIDPREDFAVAAEFNVPGGCMAADYYNGTIFIVNWPNGWLFRFNSDGENLGNLDVPIQPTAMSINQEEGWLLLMDADDNHDIVVYDLENNLDVIGRIDTYSNLIQNNTSRGINWVEKHPDGQLWMNTNNNGNVAWQIAVDEDDDFQCNEVVQSFQTHAGAAQEWDGLGHDGENLWSTSWGSAQCRIFEDGVEEVSWLSYEPAEGVIEPGGSVDITVTIDATGLWGGDYEADLIVLTNDPANPEIVVNVFVFVSCPINIWIEWDPGFPDVVDWNIAFEELFAGGPYTVPMEIINTSMDLLIVEDIISDHDYFIPTFQDVIEIEPGRSAFIEIVFNAPADDPGNYDAVLTFVSNDQDGDLEIELHAECSLPPIVVWEPDEVEDILLNFEVNEHEITISNEGDALLRWEADLEINRGPDRDFDARKIRSIESQSGPRRDHAGEQVAQFAGANVPNQYWSPVGWDEENELMFVTSYSAEQIVVYSHNDYEDFEEVRRWEMPTPMDGAWYNGTLYAKQHGEHFLHRWDSEGNALDHFQVGFLFYGVAIDQENGWIMFRIRGNGNPILVFELADDGAALGRQLGSFAHQQFMNNFTTYQIEWVDEHRDGQLWIGNSNDQRLYQILVDTDEWEAVEVVQSFPARITQIWDACCHDGEYIWVGGYRNANFRIYDDGVRELHWLTYEPTSGVIDPGGEEIITVTFETHGLYGGLYSAELMIHTNDPANPEIVIGISVEVFAPWIFPFEWEPGYPDLIDFYSAFREMHIGESYSIPVSIQNLGVDLLIVETAICDYEVFHIDWEGIEIEAGDEFRTEIIFEPEEVGERQEGSILVEFNDPDWDEYIIHVRGWAGEGFDLEHFIDYEETETSHQITITSLTMEEDHIPSGWEIGLFTPDDILAGGNVWYRGGRPTLEAYGDNPITEEVEGFVDGEYIRIRAWDRESGIEYTARPEVAEGSLYWEADGETTLSLDVADDLFGFFIHEDWNLMSINIYPNESYYIENENRGGPDVEIMMHAAMPDLDDHPILMKDEDGRFWASAWAMCLLPFWDLTEGYMMKFGRDIELFWLGELIPPDTEIPIEEGWNYVAYLPTYELPCVAPDFYAFDSILDEILLAKDPDGNFLAPQFEFSNMPPLQAGRGYQIKMSSDVVFSYPPEPEEEVLEFNGHAQQNLIHYDRVEGTGANMSLLLRGDILQPGTEIGVYSSTGMLIGSAPITANGICGLAVWGDDPTTEEFDGSSYNESLEVRMWNSSDNKEIDLCSLAGNPIYQTDDFIVSDVSVKPEVPMEYHLSEAFPNPFNSTVQLNYEIPEASEVSIKIFDTAGRMVANLLDNEVEAGFHHVLWDGKDATSGVYLISMRTNSYYSTRKVTLIR